MQHVRSRGSRALPPDAAAEEIVARARERAGLEDLGSGSYREGLELLIESIDSERTPRQREIRQALDGMFLTALVNRLRLIDYAKRHPEVTNASVQAPLIVLGMSRSGTTLTSNLLAQDRDRRSLLLWEAWDSVPPPSAATLRSDPRCRERLKAEREAFEREPYLRPHMEWADGPTECLRLHAQDFKALMWEAYLPVRAYSRWMMSVDMTSAYEYQKLALQVLQSDAPGAWSLKMPSHALHIEWLVKVFPDARLVWTHRDPYRALASLLSMKSGKWRRFCGEDGIDWLREHYVWQQSEHVKRPMRLRARIGDQRIYDLPYWDLVADPIAQMRALYEWAGDEMTEETEARMRRWLQDNPQGRYGVHEYELSQFGLSTKDLAPHFADYLAVYDVVREGS